jgi:threonine 3-dehydrogenase
MGASTTFIANDSIIDRVMDETGGKGVDVVLEMSGAAAAIQDSLKVLKCSGSFVAFGLTSRPLEIDLNNQIIFKGVRIIGVVGRRLWETWQQAAKLLSSRSVSLEPIVTHRYGLKDISEAFKVMESGQSGKVVIFPNQ